MSLNQHVISEAKVAAREHLFAVTIVSKCAGFSHERIDDMTVVNARGLLTNESWHRLYFMSLVSDRDRFGADFYVNFLTD